MQGRRKQVAPVETPDDLALRPRENAGQENGGGCIVGKVRTSGHLMKGPGRYAAARQMMVDGVDAEGQHRMPTAHSFDLRDVRTQLVDDGGFGHGDKDSKICSLFVRSNPAPESMAFRSLYVPC